MWPCSSKSICILHCSSTTAMQQLIEGLALLGSERVSEQQVRNLNFLCNILLEPSSILSVRLQKKLGELLMDTVTTRTPPPLRHRRHQCKSCVMKETTPILITTTIGHVCSDANVLLLCFPSSSSFQHPARFFIKSKKGQIGLESDQTLATTTITQQLDFPCQILLPGSQLNYEP